MDDETWPKMQRDLWRQFQAAKLLVGLTEFVLQLGDDTEALHKLVTETGAHRFSFDPDDMAITVTHDHDDAGGILEMLAEFLGEPETLGIWQLDYADCDSSEEPMLRIGIRA